MSKLASALHIAPIVLAGCSSTPEQHPQTTAPLLTPTSTESSDYYNIPQRVPQPNFQVKNIQELLISPLFIEYYMDLGMSVNYEYSSDLANILLSGIQRAEAENKTAIVYETVFPLPEPGTDEKIGVKIVVNRTQEEGTLGKVNTSVMVDSYDPITNTITFFVDADTDSLNPPDFQHMSTKILQRYLMFASFYQGGMDRNEMLHAYEFFLDYIRINSDNGYASLLEAYALHQACVTANRTAQYSNIITMDLVDIHNSVLGKNPVIAEQLLDQFIIWTNESLKYFYMEFDSKEIGNLLRRIFPPVYGRASMAGYYHSGNFSEPHFDLTPDYSNSLHARLFRDYSREPLALGFDADRVWSVDK